MWAKSIYLKDPNGISLEFCCLTRDVGNEDDVTMQERAEISIEKWLGDNGPFLHGDVILVANIPGEAAELQRNPIGRPGTVLPLCL